MNDASLNIKIPQEMYDKLKEVATSKGLSLASLVRMVCAEYLEKQ